MVGIREMVDKLLILHIVDLDGQMLIVLEDIRVNGPIHNGDNMSDACCLQSILPSQ